MDLVLITVLHMGVLLLLIGLLRGWFSSPVEGDYLGWNIDDIDREKYHEALHREMASRSQSDKSDRVTQEHNRGPMHRTVHNSSRSVNGHHDESNRTSETGRFNENQL